MEGYAVSGQCMALVRDNCLVPTKDAPELGYIRESSDKQFVPDVYYKVSPISILFRILLTFSANQSHAQRIYGTIQEKHHQVCFIY